MERDFTKIVDRRSSQYQPKRSAVTFNLGERVTGTELEQLVEHGASAIEPILTAQRMNFTGWDKGLHQNRRIAPLNAQTELAYIVTFELSTWLLAHRRWKLERLVVMARATAIVTTGMDLD